MVYYLFINVHHFWGPKERTLLASLGLKKILPLLMVTISQSDNIFAGRRLTRYQLTLDNMDSVMTSLESCISSLLLKPTKLFNHSRAKPIRTRWCHLDRSIVFRFAIF